MAVCLAHQRGSSGGGGARNGVRLGLKVRGMRMSDQGQDAGPVVRRKRGFGWGELLGGIVLALTPVAGTLAYDTISRPSGEVAAAADMLVQIAPHIDAYRRQSDLFDVNSRRVANAMLRGGSQEAAQTRYDDFTLVWSDYQTTYSDLRDLILPADNTAAPELRDLVSYMDGAMAASKSRFSFGAALNVWPSCSTRSSSRWSCWLRSTATSSATGPWTRCSLLHAHPSEGRPLSRTGP